MFMIAHKPTPTHYDIEKLRKLNDNFQIHLIV